MKTFLTFFISILIFQNVSLSDIRKTYQNANANKQNALKFYEELKDYSGNNQTILGYKGAAFTLQTKFSGTKETKKENFIKGVAYLESAIKNEPDNLELRLIRLSIQENVPKMLKYKMNMDEDKDLILKKYDSQTNDIKQYIKSYVKNSHFFTEAEKNKLK